MIEMSPKCMWNNLWLQRNNTHIPDAHAPTGRQHTELWVEMYMSPYNQLENRQVAIEYSKKGRFSALSGSLSERELQNQQRHSAVRAVCPCHISRHLSRTFKILDKCREIWHAQTLKPLHSPWHVFHPSFSTAIVLEWSLDSSLLDSPSPCTVSTWMCRHDYDPYTCTCQW